MARARNIKPGFFTNEDMVELPFEVRLLFIGLWTLADREGRLEDRPKKVKMEVFPADSVDVDLDLDLLMTHGFISRYEMDGNKYIQILNFNKHQHPHHKEVQSTIPEQGQAPDLTLVHVGQTPTKDSSDPSDSLIPCKGYPSKERSNSQFDPFWLVYPKKRKKKTAREIWRRKKLDKRFDLILADIELRMKTDSRWLQGFIPDPTTYLNQERWEDEIEKLSADRGRASNGKRSDDEWITAGQRNGVKPKVGETMQAFIQRVQKGMGQQHAR